MSGNTQGAAENRKKPRGRPFPPGNSANPGGRPKLPEDVKHVRELARQYTEQAIEGLLDALQNGSGPAKVAAANALLDRGWGKPQQDVDVKMNVSGGIVMIPHKNA
ncbi:MAG: hypothetical protein KGL39_23730 [Patescibacteria group bacterium]|nr:hypothetical protein [Patescibacteria group bacterium]